MEFREFLHSHTVCLDGGMGTQLQAAGLQPGEYPERWNLTHPQTVQSIHRAYYEAGSHVVCTNTFGANRLHFSAEELPKIVEAAVNLAFAARESCSRPGEKYVALDIGPSGRLLKPYGDMDFEEAVELFAQTIRLGAAKGVDLILIETMNDSYETKAALLAAKENSTLPVVVTNAYGSDGKLMTGASPEAMAALLEGMGADAIGANCSLGPQQLLPVARRLTACASVPVVIKPNAGLPRSEGGKTVYDVGAEEFADQALLLLKQGVRAVGGCCGTTPAYIAALTEKIAGFAPLPIEPKTDTVVSSYTHTVTFGREPVLIGERINPTGKKRFKQALLEEDMEYILKEGIRQQERGVHILDVNVGLPQVDEPRLLTKAVCALQAVVDLPLQLDTADSAAMEAALRRYNGKALINSVNGKKESMDTVFPLMKKYGGVAVALTLDEQGIPATVQGRVDVAEKILAAAAAWGIDKKNIVFDTLAMTVSAAPDAAQVTLEALRRIREELGCHTSLGISNVSFGLPHREAINSAFFVAGLEKGLSAAIMNPDSPAMMQAYYAYRALHGLDENCADYIRAAADFGQTAPAVAAAVPAASQPEDTGSALQQAIRRGLAAEAANLTNRALEQTEPMAIVQEEIIPALDSVGKAFEEKTLYLPQLLMAAEAAQSAFGCIKKAMAVQGTMADKAAFVLATVKGDIHDIGKNIVKLLLENYGFAVTDLGKDVSPQDIADAVVRLHAPLAGLSALMTTTVPAMEETVQLLHEQAPWCKVVVGGAVLNKEYAARMGADFYAADAMEAVHYGKAVLEG